MGNSQYCSCIITTFIESFMITKSICLMQYQSSIGNKNNNKKKYVNPYLIP